MEAKKSSSEHIGTLGWTLLTTGVLLWDFLAAETLSGAVDRALEHKHMRYVAIGAVAITSAHLLNVLPEKLDPIAHLGKQLGELRHG